MCMRRVLVCFDGRAGTLRWLLCMRATSIARNDIGGKCTAFIAEMLAGNRTLRHLDMSNSSFNDASAAVAMATGCSLSTLVLANCKQDTGNALSALIHGLATW